MRFRKKLSKGSVLAILMALSVLTTLWGPKLAVVIRRPAQAVLAPLADGGMYFATAVKQHAHDMLEADVSAEDARLFKEENLQLRGQVSALKQRLIDKQHELATVQQLDSLLFGPRADIPCELIPAHVVEGDSLSYGQVRVLRTTGASKGSPVTTRVLQTDRSKAIQNGSQQFPAISPVLPSLETVTAAALVGRLTDAGPFTAQLQLVTDRGFRMRARILRQLEPTRPRVIQDGTRMLTLTPEYNPPTRDVMAQGDGGDKMIVKDVDDTLNIQEGDWLVSCSDDPLLPAEVRIGRVKEVRPGSKGGFVSLTIEPFADLEGLRDVYIVAPNGKGAAKEGARP